jgi:hypothetical protein
MCPTSTLIPSSAPVDNNKKNRIDYSNCIGTYILVGHIKIIIIITPHLIFMQLHKEQKHKNTDAA